MSELPIAQSFDLAVKHHQAGRLHDAEVLYRQILTQQPEHAEAMHLLGVIAHQVGRNDVAVDLIRQAIAIKPNFPEAFSNLGTIFVGQREFDGAIAAYRQAIALRPSYAEAHSNLSVALNDRGEIDEAIAACRRAIALRPDDADAFNNLGNPLVKKGDVDEAIASYRHALALRPSHPDALNNLGATLAGAGRVEEAIGCYRRAIALKPDFAKAHSNLGSALKDLGKLDEAIASFRQANLGGNFVEAQSNLLYALHFHAGYRPEQIAEEHRVWNRQHAEPLRKLIRPLNNSRERDRRLVVGYVSPDFQAHSVSRFLLPLLREHDHGAFEIICYSDTVKVDSVTDELRACADRWHNIAGASDERVADLIRQDKVDILVDLAGHTASNRLLVFARRPAPIQISYLGYPGTTGLAEMDYRFTDALADPPSETESFHIEKLWRLPVCNWCFDAPSDSPPPAPARGEGLICFGTFNNFAKASPEIMDAWAEILSAIPSSRLLIKSQGLGERGIQREIIQFFESRGLGPDRLEIRGREPGVKSHLELYNRVDIALDTFPYHGTTTTCEALWMGVPVITLAGESHVSRVGVSLLSCVGIPELIAQSREEYVSMAVALAKDLPRLAELRRTLRTRMLASPLMDGRRFARDVEEAFRGMWGNWCVGREDF